MTSVKNGDVVRSVAGHDKGLPFVVVGMDGDLGYLLLADGKTRSVTKPKKKKMKHCRLIPSGKVEAPTAYTDADIRKYLKLFLSEEA